MALTVFASFQIWVNWIVGLGLVSFRSGAVAYGADRLPSILALGEGVRTYTSSFLCPVCLQSGNKIHPNRGGSVEHERVRVCLGAGVVASDGGHVGRVLRERERERERERDSLIDSVID